MKPLANLTFAVILCLSSCQEAAKEGEVNNAEVATPEKIKEEPASIEKLIVNLEDASNDQVLVVAHRGDWRGAPENSLQAIQNCIDMGVDMVEIDVRRTKDGQLVLMHDETIDRTTTGKGAVSELTWEYLKSLNLRDGIGHSTPHRIPTLEEALLLTKDRILVNLDKSYDIFDACFEIAEKTGTLSQIIIKGAKTRQEVEMEFGQYLDKVFFMPIIQLEKSNISQIVEGYMEKQVPVAFEFTIPQDTISFIEKFGDLRERGASIWVNSLWSNHIGGHDDEKAVLDNSVYDWYIDHNVDIIQTDRPQVLLDYLRSKKLHN